MKGKMKTWLEKHKEEIEVERRNATKAHWVVAIIMTLILLLAVELVIRIAKNY